MEVLNAVIHRIDKIANEATSTVYPASSLLPLNDVVKRVTDEIRELYTRRVVYGVFEGDEENYRFQPLLRDCVHLDWNDFLNFTTNLLNILQIKMNAASASAGAYVMFIHYREHGSDFLFVIMMNDTVGASVTSALGLRDTIHLDLSKLHVAARINISSWIESDDSQDPEHKYVSFIRGTRDVSNYFVSFIGCTEITKPKESTNKIIDILFDFARDKEFSEDEKEDSIKVCEDYLMACFNDDRDASIETLSTLLNENEPNDFLDFACGSDYEMSALFRVDKTTLKRLRRIHYKSSQLNITMTDTYVREHIEINEGNLTISNAPPELLDEINLLL